MRASIYAYKAVEDIQIVAAGDGNYAARFRGWLYRSVYSAPYRRPLKCGTSGRSATNAQDWPWSTERMILRVEATTMVSPSAEVTTEVKKYRSSVESVNGSRLHVAP